MSKITLKRTGQAPLKFEGALIARINGSHAAGNDPTRYFGIDLYRVDAVEIWHVAQVVYHTRWDGEPDIYEAFAGTAEDVRDWLVNFTPEKHLRGFPPGDHYADRQARLVRDLRENYQICVSSLLDLAAAIHDDFGETL